MRIYKLFKSGIPIGGRPSEHTPEKMGTNEEPWYTRGAIEFLHENIKDSFEILEYGCGSSTPWFAQRAKSITSIEHNKQWIDNVVRATPEKLMEKINITHIPNKKSGKNIGGDGFYYDEYVDYINSMNMFFDLICLDGRSRSACIKNSINYVKKNGFLLIDNAERIEYKEAINQIPDNWERFVFEESVDTTIIFKVI